MNVFLRPQIQSYNPGLSQYTGSDYSNLTDAAQVISNPAAFFAGYKAYVMQLATLAQQHNVQLLSIGNEMLSATKPIPEYIDHWKDIIASIRTVYTGKLTYSALTDVLYPSQDEVSQITFWDRLDYVGVDIYPRFPTTGNEIPSVAQLDAQWTTQGWKTYLENIANKYNKPIIFTESGVASYVGATNRTPPNTDAKIGDASAQSDNKTQANWYQSFFNTWSGNNKPSWLVGSFFWNNDPQVSGSYATTGYSIYEKPAGIIVTSELGGVNYLSANQTDFTGSINNDIIALYGNVSTPEYSVPPLPEQSVPAIPEQCVPPVPE